VSLSEADYPFGRLARELAPPYAGEGGFASWHFSEDPALSRFRPRAPLADPGGSPLVWAVHTRHALMFGFLRDCPRGCIWVVSTTTVEDRERFFGQAAAERAVGRVMTAVEAANPGAGSAPEALDRMLAASWNQLAGYAAMAQEVAELLSSEAVTRTLQAAHKTVGALVERGQADGSFRTDLPASWLVTACLALSHACSDCVRAGSIDQRDALHILRTSVRDLFTGAEEPARNAEVEG